LKAKIMFLSLLISNGRLLTLYQNPSKM